MVDWIDNGCQPGWLIDTDTRTAYVYRTGQEPEEITELTTLSGETVLPGFALTFS